MESNQCKLNLRDLKLKPRPYQIKAAKIALSQRRSIMVLPTGTGKTLIGLIWIKNLIEKNLAKKIIVLEPTRILVEQVADFLKKVGGLEATPIHGFMSKEIKNRGWRDRIIVTTPEEALFHIDELVKFDAVLIDECHHAVGDDAYRKVLEILPADWRLGLSAHIPTRHKRFIEKLIGETYEWRTDDPEVAPYIPDWIGEIYETPLDEKAMQIYKEIELLWSESRGKDRMIYALALRFLSRDGPIALKESVLKNTLLAKKLLPYKEEILGLRDLHKLEKLLKALDQHEFSKAIVFVDRVVVAHKLYEELSEFRPVLIIGRRKTSDEKVKDALLKARDPETKIIISTSAGEEGIDLPSADLLLLWSNVVSPLRFIQRHGRILRKTKPLKYVAYLVTPDTIDMNAFLDSIMFAKKVGVDIGIDEELIQKLARKSPRATILEALETPIPIEWLSQITGLSITEVRKALKLFQSEGEVFYVFTPLGKTYMKQEHIPLLLEEYPDYFNPKNVNARIIIPVGCRKINIYGNFEKVSRELSKLFEKQEIPSLRVVIRELIDSIEYVYTLQYAFKIKSKEILEIVLANAFSEIVYRSYG